MNAKLPDTSIIRITLLEMTVESENILLLLVEFTLKSLKN